MVVETGLETDSYTGLARKTPSASQGSILKRDPSSKTVRTRGSSTPKKSVSFDPTPEVFYVPSRCESRTDNPTARTSPQSPTDVSTYLLHYQGNSYERNKSLRWDSYNSAQPSGLVAPTGIHAELYSVAASLSNLVPRRRLRDLLVNTEELQDKMKKFQEDTEKAKQEESKDVKGDKKPEPVRTVPLARPTRQIKPFRVSITNKYQGSTNVNTQQTDFKRTVPVVVDLKPKRKPKNFEQQPSVFKRLYLHSHPNEGPPKEEVKIPEIKKKETRPVTAKSSRSERTIPPPVVKERDRDKERDKDKERHHHRHHHHHHKDKDKDRQKDLDRERERQKARERLYGTASRGNSRPKAAKPTSDRHPPRPPPTTPPSRPSRPRPHSRAANVPVQPSPPPAPPKPAERTKPPPDDRSRLFPRTALEKFVMAELQRSRMAQMAPSAGPSNRGSPSESNIKPARPTPAFKLPETGVRHIGYASTRERKVSWKTGEVQTLESSASKHTPIMKRFSIAFRSPVKV